MRGAACKSCQAGSAVNAMLIQSSAEKLILIKKRQYYNFKKRSEHENVSKFQKNKHFNAVLNIQYFTTFLDQDEFFILRSIGRRLTL